MVIATCEVIAALLGSPASDLNPEIVAWVRVHQYLDATGLRERALAQLEVVLNPDHSEIRQLWGEAGDGDWFSAIDDLKARLRGW